MRLDAAAGTYGGMNGCRPADPMHERRRVAVGLDVDEHRVGTVAGDRAAHPGALETDAREPDLLRDVLRLPSAEGVACHEDVLGGVTLLGRRGLHSLGEAQCIGEGPGCGLGVDHLEVGQDLRDGDERLNNRLVPPVVPW